MNSKYVKIISVVGFAVIILGLIIIPKSCSRQNEEPQTKAKRSGVIAVAIKIVKPETFKNKLQVAGSVISNEEVELHAELSGKIIHIGFKEGGRVNKGDLLLKVNDADLQAQLQKAIVNQKLAEDKEYRQKILLGKKGVSQETYDAVLNSLNAAKADVENVKAQIAKTEIHAPFSGTVGLRYVSEGGYVTPSTKIATLQNINPVKVDFSIPQRFADIIAVGNLVKVKTSSGKEYGAKVYAVEPKIDPATRALQVRAICSNERGELRPGSYVTVNMELNDVRNAITIPTQAIALDISGESVFIFKNGVAVSKKVECGIRTEEQVQIISGVSVGDSIITSGIMQLRPNTKVKIYSVEGR